jgi:hypothetical protein
LSPPTGNGFHDISTSCYHIYFEYLEESWAWSGYLHSLGAETVEEKTDFFLGVKNAISPGNIDRKKETCQITMRVTNASMQCYDLNVVFFFYI